MFTLATRWNKWWSQWYMQEAKVKSWWNHNVTENIVDRNLELTDPTPDIQHLFKSLDARCFAGLLSRNRVQLKWSTSMELCCAGRCIYTLPHTPDENPVRIELSERLLKFRTRRDLVEILLVNSWIYAHLYAILSLHSMTAWNDSCIFSNWQQWRWTSWTQFSKSYAPYQCGDRSQCFASTQFYQWNCFVWKPPLEMQWEM